MSFCFSSLFAVSFFVSIVCDGAIYYDDDGDIMTGDDLIEMCYQNQVCNTHFSKNVYASSQPVLDHEWTPLLFPDMYDQFDSESECGSGSKFIQMDTCAQIHSPMTLYHAEGDVKVSYVAEQYSLKWDNIRKNNYKKYDSILDNSVAFWTDDLAKYHSLWTELGADMVFLKWQIKDTNHVMKNNKQLKGKIYYSIITHNGDKSTGSTLTQYELISDTFSSLTEDILLNKMISSEQRAFFDGETDYRKFSNGCETLPIGARRAVSSVDDNVEWYKKIFAASILDSSKQIIVDEYINEYGNKVKYAHIKLYPSEESTTVSFFERNFYGSTYGDFEILDFEKAMTDTHNENMITPFCGIDRWFDMHYAVDFDDATTSEKVLETMMKSGEKYTVYAEWIQLGVADAAYPTFVYMTEPNGHSVQLIFDMNIDISFYTAPANWESNWCPIDCSDDMLEYSYGDDIASFSWDKNSKSSITSTAGSSDTDSNGESYQSYKLFITPESQTTSGQKISNVAVFIAGIGVFIALVLVIVCNFCPNWDRFKYEQLPQ